MLFSMLISPLPGANPSLPEHKIGVFVRFCQQDELNEQDEPNELNERDKQDKKNGRVC